MQDSPDNRGDERTESTAFDPPRGAAAPDLPREIGGYRIVRKLGEGGMGVVFEAEQREPRRPVAVKVIRGGRYIDDGMIRLFTREAQALGRLSHPGIAGIYEFGRTDDGQPFFAMELVRGVSLAEFLAGRPSPLESRRELDLRLRLFRKICDAVNYAHQRAVIHRDLKPGNILVLRGSRRAHTDPARRVVPDIKVLDFGMARITEGDVAAVTAVTQAGKIQGTLAYMSPEQARGNPDEIDLRSDVYALGVILYQMISGRLPYDLRGVTLPEAVRKICEQSPTTLRRAMLSRSVDRDLETIVLTALEKDPSRRYQSVASLAADVERFSVDQPILARPPSTRYQLLKLVRRHKLVVAFTTAIIALVAVLAVTMTLQANRVARQRDAARQANARAESLNAFLLSLFDGADPDFAPGRTVTARDLLDAGAKRITRGDADPQLRASLMTTIGVLYRRLGQYEDARSLIERGLEIRTMSPAIPPVEAAASRVELAKVLDDLGEYARAEQVAREAVQTLRRENGSESLADALLILGTALFRLGRADEAEPVWAEGLGMAEASDRVDLLLTAATLHNMALLEEQRGNLEEATELYRRSLELKERQLGLEGTPIALTLNSLAEVHRKRGDCATAEPLYRRSLEISTMLLGPENESVAMVWNNLAECAKSGGELERAATLYARALEIFEGRLGSDHPHVATALFNLGDVELRRGRPREAEPLLQRSLNLTQAELGRDHLYVAETLAALGAVAAGLGNQDEAERRFREALTILEADRWSRHATRADVLSRYAEWLAEIDRPEDARRARRLAEEIRGSR